MQYSRISILAAITYIILFCYSCREAIGEQQGTTPSESGPPSPKKEVIKKPEPGEETPKIKNGRKSISRDTLSPKIALS